MLCSACLDVLSGPFQTGHSSWSLPSQPHSPSGRDLQQSAENCNLCAQVYWKLLRLGFKLTDEIRCQIRGDAEVKTELLFYIPSTAGLHAEFNLTPELEVKSQLPNYKLAPDLSSDATLELAKGWIDSCVKTHVGCGPMPRQALPTRLLDVGNEEDEKIRVHISEAGQNTSDTPYISLSHSWGNTKFLQLTTSNFKQLTNEIPISDLPLTFQHAVKLARQLGQRFLWIDSLCIIQDSRDDWQQEAARMQAVYKNAFCNIAATSGSHEIGLFSSRDPKLFQTIKAEIPRLSKLMALDGKNISSPIFYITDRRQFIDDVSLSPLNQRSWVIQERLLSPRILHYSSQQLYFECNTSCFCEAFPSGPPNQWLDHFIMIKKGGMSLQALRTTFDAKTDDESDFHPLLKRYGRWNALVEVYTTCQLSHEEDKLIALSGIAAEMQYQLQDEYLAGLWRKDLPYHLLWHTIAPGESWSNPIPTYCPIPYRAPSWSWASVQGPVFMYGFRHIAHEKTREIEEPMIEILDVTITAQGTNMMGQIANGIIHLRGKTRIVKCVEGGGNPMRNNGSLVLDSEDKVVLDADNRGEPIPKQLTLLAVLRKEDQNRDYAQQDWEGSYTVYCLVLVPVDGTKDVYRRVGMTTVTENVLGVKNWDIEDGELKII